MVWGRPGGHVWFGVGRGVMCGLVTHRCVIVITKMQVPCLDSLVVHN